MKELVESYQLICSAPCGVVCVAKGKRGEKQQKHNKMELKRMIYSYQQTEKGEQMMGDGADVGLTLTGYICAIWAD